MSRRLFSGRRGFTLIELVVAITVAGVAVSLGYAAIGTLADRRGAAERATQGTLRAFAVRDNISRWIAGARLDAQGSAAVFRGLHGIQGGVPDDDITFLTTAATPLGDGDAVVHLYIKRDAAGKPLGLAAELADWHGVRQSAVLLDSTVAGMSIRYRMGVFSTGAWLDNWLSATVLPGGVQLSLLPARQDSLPALLRTPVVVALEGGR